MKDRDPGLRRASRFTAWATGIALFFTGCGAPQQIQGGEVSQVDVPGQSIVIRNCYIDPCVTRRIRVTRAFALEVGKTDMVNCPIPFKADIYECAIVEKRAPLTPAS